MHIINCVKVVRSSLVYQDSLEQEGYAINPYDLLALQKAIHAKERFGGSVNCISMGANCIRESLVKCIAMGTDEVYWLNDSAFAGSDTVATSYILSKGIKKIRTFDLIICGAESVDGETGQVGIGIAQRLQIPCVTSVEEIIECKNDYIVVRTLNSDYDDIIKVKFPALIVFKNFTLVSNKISLLSLKHAQKKNLNIWKINNLKLDKALCGFEGSRTKVIGMESDLIKKDSLAIEGNSSTKAKAVEKIICSRM